MKKLFLKTFSIILTLSVLMLTLSLTTNLFSTKADIVGFGMNPGAQVRMPGADEEDVSGIRFTAELTKGAFNNITSGTVDAVYFGIELTANGISKDNIYLVDDTDKITEAKQEIDFGDKSTFTYVASVLYNEAELKNDLITAGKIKANDADAFDAYLKQAYATEITAKSFYKVGNSDKVYGTGEVTRSIWGVASAAYLEDSEEYKMLAEKYFTFSETKNVDVIYETGEILYDGFKVTDKLYLDATLVTLTDGKLASSLYINKGLGDTIKLAVIDKDGNLTVINGTFVSNGKTIETQAFYDAQADKIYYKEKSTDKEFKTLQGTSDYSFNYVLDATTSYPLANYNSGSLVSNVNYKYADSVEFSWQGKETVVKKEDRALVGSLNPRIITEDGYVTAKIDYNQHTDVYKGVTVSIDNNVTKYTFTDVVIVSQMIDDGAELKQVFNQADKDTGGANVESYTKNTKYGTITKGVYMLAKDIDADKSKADGFKFDNSYFNYFEGVFDGRGFNIYNLDVSGSETNPGNGLFSAVSTYSSIQNVGFINVTANYGSVFQGNLFDIRLSGATVVGTYYSSDFSNKAISNTSNRVLGSTYYRKQMGIAEDDVTSLMSKYLKSGSRRNLDTRYSTIWSNVYVKVNPETQRLMGVISRNMPATHGVLSGNNVVIEYLPEKLYDSELGKNDGAFPYNYDYTGEYGVLFGGAYDTDYIFNGYNADGKTNYKARYDCPNQYVCEDDKSFIRDYYTPINEFVNSNYGKDSLVFANHSLFTHGTWFNCKIYVISELGLVSSVKGKILGTNETADDNQLKFIAKQANLYTAAEYGGARGEEHVNEMFKLERYDSYAKATAAGYVTNAQLTSYMLDDGAEEKYWNIDNGYLQWING